MRELTFLGPGSLEWREVPVPGPFPLGHEFVAEVVEVGEEVRGVAPGARVAVPFAISCGRCQRCRRGVTASCSTVPVGAMYGLPLRGRWGGGMSDLVRVPYADAMLVPLPDGVAATTVASLSDNLPDAWRTVAPHLAARPGAEVLIAGAGR